MTGFSNEIASVNLAHLFFLTMVQEFISIEEHAPIYDLARQAKHKENVVTDNEYQCFLDGFIAGYSANQSKYSEEDIRKAIQYGLMGTPSEFIDHDLYENKFIQSIQTKNNKIK